MADKKKPYEKPHLLSQKTELNILYTACTTQNNQDPDFLNMTGEIDCDLCYDYDPGTPESFA